MRSRSSALFVPFLLASGCASFDTDSDGARDSGCIGVTCVARDAPAGFGSSDAKRGDGAKDAATQGTNDAHLEGSADAWSEAARGRDAGLHDAPQPDGRELLDAPADVRETAFDATPTVATSLVLFGGQASGLTAVGDTWSWNGSSWTKASSTGPSPRWFALMASLPGSVVLFGGINVQDNDTTYADTWTWDGTSWTQHDVQGPSGYNGCIATVAGKVVVFGGSGTQDFADTWTWDGSSWTKLAVTGPSGRGLCAMTTVGESAVLFGGYNSTGWLSDTWIWDGSSWTQASPGSPPVTQWPSLARFGSSSAVLFGEPATGSPTAPGPTWIWSNGQWTAAANTASGPTVRDYPALATFNQAAILFGGGVYDNPNDLLGDAWSFGPSGWTSMPSGPTPRLGAGMAEFFPP